ncbi:hypothetical protein DUNSADRAFT_18151 [Dunaliella salina]|uniref:Uncharacterized protein n=1 Tax=Dunaliella salina TaxID=3046 RepID=A0ABQ7GZK3_DUNSA|nr:hypothetical protein DUNSADRAFT_18151 [Dunaliella salina]|eukprot:KAF5839991.1 hypothetical protein DUNSADRAFT_18151 [Dunaliella salina]
MTTSAAASSNAAASISAGIVSSVLCGRASLAHSNGSWLQCVHTPLRRQASAGVSTRDSKSSSSSKGKNIEVRAAHKGPVNTSKGSKGKGATRSSSLGAVEPDAANMGSMEPEATKMVSVEPEATKAGPVKDEAAKAGPVGPKATKVGPVKHEATKVGPVKRATTKMGHSAGVRAERQAAHAGPVEPGDSKAGTKHGRGRPPGSGTKRAPLPARLSLQQKRKPQVKQQQPSSTEQGGSLLQGEQAYAQASKSRHVDSPAGTGLAHSSITSAQGSRRTQRSSPALPQPSSADAPVHSTSAATSHSSSWRNQYRVVNSFKSQPKAALEQQPVQLPQQPLQPNPPAAAAISQQRLEEPKPRSPPSPSSDAARMHQHYLEQPTHRVPQQNMEFLPSQQAPQQRLAQPTQQAPQQRNMDFLASQQPLQQDTERPARGNPQLRSLHAARTPQQSLKNLAPQAPQQQHPLPLNDTSQQPNKPPIGTSSASTNVEQPTATLKDHQQPTAILKDPQQPTAILDRPQQPTTTRKHPQQLTATLKNPKQPTTTRKDPQQPTATLEAPQHLIAASEHRKWPTTTLLKDPKQLTALIRHCHNLDQLADLLHRHCGISAINHSALQRTCNLNGSFDGTVGPWSLSGSGATAHVQGRGGGGGGGGAAAQSSSSYGFFEGSSSSSSNSTGGGTGRLTKGRRRRSSDSIAPSETLNSIGNERDTAEAGASPTEAAAGQEPEQAPIRTPAAALTTPPAQSPQPPTAGTQPPPCLDGVALSAALHRLAVLAPVPDVNDANAHSSDAGHNGRVSTSHELGRPSAAPAPLHSAGAADTSSDSSSGSAPISATSVARHESGAPRSNAPTDGAASGSPAFPASTLPPLTPPHPVSLGTQQPLQPSAVAGAGGAAAAGAAVSGVPAAGAAGVAAAAGAAGGAAAAEALERDGDRTSLPTFGCAEDAQRLADALLEAGMTNGLLQDPFSWKMGTKKKVSFLRNLGLKSGWQLTAGLFIEKEIGGPWHAVFQLEFSSSDLRLCIEVRKLQDMGWRELSSLLWSAAHLGFRACAHTDNFAIDAQDSRPSAAAAFAAEQQQGPTGRAVHPITGQSPAPWMKAVLQRMASIGFHAADAQALSNTIWALSRLGVVPGQAWMMSYLQVLTGKQVFFVCSSGLGGTSGFLVLDAKGPQLERCQAVQATLPRLQAQHLTNILYALAKLHLLQRQQEQEGRLESLLPPAEAWMSAFLHEVSGLNSGTFERKRVNGFAVGSNVCATDVSAPEASLFVGPNLRNPADNFETELIFANRPKCGRAANGLLSPTAPNWVIFGDLESLYRKKLLKKNEVKKPVLFERRWLASGRPLLHCCSSIHKYTGDCKRHQAKLFLHM